MHKILERKTHVFERERRRKGGERVHLSRIRPSLSRRKLPCSPSFSSFFFTAHYTQAAAAFLLPIFYPLPRSTRGCRDLLVFFESGISSPLSVQSSCQPPCHATFITHPLLHSICFFLTQFSQNCGARIFPDRNYRVRRTHKKQGILFVKSRVGASISFLKGGNL